MTSGQPMSATSSGVRLSSARSTRPQPTQTAKCQVNGEHRPSPQRRTLARSHDLSIPHRGPPPRATAAGEIPFSCLSTGSPRSLTRSGPSIPRSGRRRRRQRGRSASGRRGYDGRERGVRALLEQDGEAGGVEDRATEGQRPCRPSSPGFSPTTTKSVFFDTDPLTLPPGLLHGERGAVARPALDRAGDHHGDPVERAGTGVEPLLGHAYAGRAPLARRPRGASRRRTTRRRPSAMIGPTPSTAASSSTRRGGDAVEVAELAGERLGGGGADVADRQRHDDAPQRPGLRGLELAEQLLGVGREHPAVGTAVAGEERRSGAGRSAVSAEDVALVVPRRPRRAARSPP